MQAILRRLDSGRGLLLMACVAIIGLAAVLTPSTEAVSVFGVELPALCLWRNVTGLPCPGCGLTRSFTFLAHGHLDAAVRMNVLGPLLFVVVASQIPWQIYRIWFSSPATAETGPGTEA
ncbi:MAG: DUF2752 domain-containing protein [Myxococcota bacterium]